MPWLLVDLALAVLALVVLAVVGLVLFRAVKALLRRTGGLSSLLADSADGLAVVTPSPTSGATVSSATRRTGRPRR